MKHSFTYFCLSLFAVLSMLSCSPNEDAIGLEVYSTRGAFLTPLTGGGLIVTQDMLPWALKSFLDPTLFVGKDKYKYSVTTITEEDRNLIYVLNLDEGGWVLVSGIIVGTDTPILAFNETGRYDPYDLPPCGSSCWLANTIVYISHLMDKYI